MIVLITYIILINQGKRKDQGVPQSQTAALPRHQEDKPFLDYKMNIFEEYVTFKTISARSMGKKNAFHINLLT